MRSRRLVAVSIVFALPVLFGQSGAADTIEHGADYGPGSNVPATSAPLCEDMPEDVAFIEGLRTGWAVAQPGSDAVLLSLSNRSLACTDEPGAALSEFEAETCLGGWSFAVLLPAELLVPGTFRLLDYKLPTKFESLGPGRPSFGCESECDHDSIPTDWWPYTAINENTLVEIYSVSDECITGRIWDPDDEPSSSTSKTGAFHAVRCEPQ